MSHLGSLNVAPRPICGYYCAVDDALLRSDFIHFAEFLYPPCVHATTSCPDADMSEQSHEFYNQVSSFDERQQQIADAYQKSAPRREGDERYDVALLLKSLGH